MKTFSRKKWLPIPIGLMVSAMVLTACSVRSAETAKNDELEGDTIVVGTSLPSSGPDAVYGIYQEGIRAYFAKVNDEGGVHGKKLELKVYDDAGEPSRTLQNAKQLVEKDDVFAVAFVVGTPANLGIRDYLNSRDVPHLLANTGAAEFGSAEEQEKYPWSTAWLPPYQDEGKAVAEYIVNEDAEATVAILSSNDDLGDSLLTGFKAGIEGSDVKIVGEQVYNSSDATVSGPVQVLAATGADYFLNYSTGSFTPQSVETAANLNWHPTTFVISWNTALQTYAPAGLENAVGFLAPGYMKEPSDPAWKDDAGMLEYFSAMEKYAPSVDAMEHNVAYGYAEAEMLVKAFEAAPELSREAVTKSLKNIDTEISMLIPGIRFAADESEQDYWPLSKLGMLRFDGEVWVDSGSLEDEN